MAILFFDTETTGKVDWQLPPADPKQPRLVQLGAILTDSDKTVKATLSVTIKPNGFEIPEAADAIHGITTHLADKFGVDIDVAMSLFAQLAERASIIVAHNFDFDNAVIGGEFGRMGWTDPFVGRDVVCTMRRATDICRIPGRKGFKWPSLAEAYQHFHGRGFDGAHDAMTDARACMDVFFKLVEAEPVAAGKGGLFK